MENRDTTRHETARALLQNEFNERRARNGRYSMRAFARSVGLSQTQLSLILSGKRDVSLPQAMKLAQALAPDFTTVEKLLGLSLLELANSKRFVTIPGEAEIGADGLPESERLTKLRRGIVIRAAEWPHYQGLVEQILRASPETAQICLAVKVFDQTAS